VHLIQKGNLRKSNWKIRHKTKYDGSNPRDGSGSRYEVTLYA
jgi:hypothetical protein